MEKTLQSKWTHISSQKVQPGKFLLLSSMNTNFVILGENVFTIPMFLFSICNNAIFDTFVPSFPNITFSRKLDIDTIQNVYSVTQWISYNKFKSAFFILVAGQKMNLVSIALCLFSDV